MFAENRLAPCMGSTVCEEYAGEDAADAAASWVVLKACVAEWELRLRSGWIGLSCTLFRPADMAVGLFFSARRGSTYEYISPAKAEISILQV